VPPVHRGRPGNGALRFSFQQAGGMSGFMCFTAPVLDLAPTLLVAEAGNDRVQEVGVVPGEGKGVCLGMGLAHVGYLYPPGTVLGPRAVAASSTTIAVTAFSTGALGRSASLSLPIRRVTLLRLVQPVVEPQSRHIRERPPPPSLPSHVRPRATQTPPLYLAGGEGQHTVHLFDAASRAPLRVLGGGWLLDALSPGPPRVLGTACGSDPGQLKSPHGLRLSRDGHHVVVADTANSRVSAFRLRDGAFLGHLLTGVRGITDVEECEGGWLVVASSSQCVAQVRGSVVWSCT
jgi:hypothetical protein